MKTNLVLLKYPLVEFLNKKFFKLNPIFIFLRIIALIFIGIINYKLIGNSNKNIILAIFSPFFLLFLFQFLNEIYFEKGNISLLWNLLPTKPFILLRVLINSLDFLMVFSISGIISLLQLVPGDLFSFLLAIAAAFSISYFIAIFIRNFVLLSLTACLTVLLLYLCYSFRINSLLVLTCSLFLLFVGNPEKSILEKKQSAYKIYKKYSDLLLRLAKIFSFILPQRLKPLFYKDIYYLGLNYFNYFRIILNFLLIYMVKIYFTKINTAHRLAIIYGISMVLFSEIPLSSFINFEKMSRELLKVIPAKFLDLWIVKFSTSGMFLISFGLLNCLIIEGTIPILFLWVIILSNILLVGASFIFFKKSGVLGVNDDFSFSSFLFEQTPFFEGNLVIILVQIIILLIGVGILMLN